MKHYVEFNIATGRIVHRGRCQPQHVPVPRRLNAIALIRASYEYNTVVCDGVDNIKIAIKPTLTRRSSNSCKPKPVKLQEGKKQAHITNEQWQDVLRKIEVLERINKILWVGKI